MFGGCFLRVGEILFGDEGGGCKCVLEEGVGMCMFDVYICIYMKYYHVVLYHIT